MFIQLHRDCVLRIFQQKMVLKSLNANLVSRHNSQIFGDFIDQGFLFLIDVDWHNYLDVLTYLSESIKIMVYIQLTIEAYLSINILIFLDFSFIFMLKVVQSVKGNFLKNLKKLNKKYIIKCIF